MSSVNVLLVGILATAAVILVTGIQSQAVIRLARRRFPTFDYDGHGCLLSGFSLLAAFALGLMVMYGLLFWH